MIYDKTWNNVLLHTIRLNDTEARMVANLMRHARASLGVPTGSALDTLALQIIAALEPTKKGTK